MGWDVRNAYRSYSGCRFLPREVYLEQQELYFIFFFSSIFMFYGIDTRVSREKKNFVIFIRLKNNLNFSHKFRTQTPTLGNTYSFPLAEHEFFINQWV